MNLTLIVGFIGDGAGFGNQINKRYRLVGLPVHVRGEREVHPPLRLRHCRYEVSFRGSIAGTL